MSLIQFAAIYIFLIIIAYNVSRAVDVLEDIRRDTSYIACRPLTFKDLQ